MAPRSGRCLCGAISYTLSSEPSMMAVCHCTHCQRQSGGVFSTNIMVDQADYVQNGETKIYRDTGDSGEAVMRHFCGDCGSPILSAVGAMPGIVIVKAGTLDDWTGLAPVVEVYTDHAAPWVVAVAGARRFAQGTD